MKSSAMAAAAIVTSFLIVPATFLMAQEGKADDPLTAEEKTAAGAEPNFDESQLLRRPGEMTLTDQEGRNLNVELISANGEMLRIKRVDDDKEFEIQMAQLDETSLTRVKNWIDQKPELLDFAIDFQVQKRLKESDKFESGGRSLKTSHWVYDISMANQTRNLLTGAEVEYRIIYDDEVAFSRTSAMPGTGMKQDGDNVELPELAFNGRAEFTTPDVELHTYEYSPTRGEKEFEKDKLVGIWIRVTKRGQVLDEYQSNAGGMKDLEWDSEDGAEIVIRDSFKDGFQPVAGADR